MQLVRSRRQLETRARFWSGRIASSELIAVDMSAGAQFARCTSLTGPGERPELSAEEGGATVPVSPCRFVNARWGAGRIAHVDRA
jgi:hypothetical protein